MKPAQQAETEDGEPPVLPILVALLLVGMVAYILLFWAYPVSSFSSPAAYRGWRQNICTQLDGGNQTLIAQCTPTQSANPAPFFPAADDPFYRCWYDPATQWKTHAEVCQA